MCCHTQVTSMQKRGLSTQVGQPPQNNPGNLLLSHGRLPQYPRRRGPSLPCSEWERVLRPRHRYREIPDETAPGEVSRRVRFAIKNYCIEG